MYALVRIVHHVNPEDLSFDDFCKLHGEAAWYVQMQSELISANFKRLFG